MNVLVTGGAGYIGSHAVRALQKLQKSEGELCADAYNLGNGSGYSVLEGIKAVERVTGSKVPYSVGERRPGDPAVLVASAEKARRELGWQAQFAKLDQIVVSAWRWHRGRPEGYRRCSLS